LADYGLANWDIPHRFVVSYIYDLPFFTTSSWPLLTVRRGLDGRSRAWTTIQSG